MKREDERRDDSVQQCLKTKNPPDELAHEDSEKSPANESFVRKFRILPVFSVIYMIRIRFFGPRE